VPDWKNEIRRRLASLRLEEAREAAIVEELAQHLDDCHQELLAGGVPAAEAERLTLAELSRSESLWRELRCLEWRVAPEPIVLGTDRRGNMIADLWQDLRFGFRMMRQAPGFAAVAILTLALGIGVNTAILSTVNGFILRPLPVERPDELVAPFWGSKKDAEVWGDVSYPNYIDLRDQNQSFSGLLAWSMTSAGISAGEDRRAGDGARAEVAWGEIVSGNYFDVLGVKPVLGRGFSPEEDRTQNTHPVVVIGHSLWQRRFSADPEIVGNTIYLNGFPFTVIGVAPETFNGTKHILRHAFWVPLMMRSKFGLGAAWETNRGWTNVHLRGRLKPGVTMAQAEADLNLIAGNLAKLYPQSNADSKVRVASELDGRIGEAVHVFRFSSRLALGVSGLVLLVACANVANLMLARAAAREREIGIRLAIGARRSRIVRQLLTESMLLALLGGALGWALAYWGTALIRASFPPIPLPLDINVTPDLYVLKWMAGVTLLTGVIFGLAPALFSSRPDLVAVIKGDAAGRAQGKWRWNLRGALVVSQVAISAAVLICAGLFLRSLNKALSTDTGFSTENMVTLMLDPGLLGYDVAAGKRFYAEVLRRVAAQPGVRAVSLASYLPLGDYSHSRGPVLKEGEPDPPPNQGAGLDVTYNVVAPNYFETTRTPLVLGRDFTPRDNADAPPVVIVNQEFARRFYGGEEQALGKRFRFRSTKEPLNEIVGVAKDGLYHNLYESPQMYLYLPADQQYKSEMTLLISADSAGSLKAIADKARLEIGQLDARVPVFGVRMAGQNMSYAYWGPRLAAGMAATFGVLALLLATTGLYSVMAYAVSRRTREIGIRMALGAQIRDVLRLILRQGMIMVTAGVVAGFAGALAATRVLSSLLFGVGANDPLTFAGVAMLLIVVASLACYLPARRAAKVDPLSALRRE